METGNKERGKGAGGKGEGGDPRTERVAPREHHVQHNPSRPHVHLLRRREEERARTECAGGGQSDEADKPTGTITEGAARQEQPMPAAGTVAEEGIDMRTLPS